MLPETLHFSTRAAKAGASCGSAATSETMTRWRRARVSATFKRCTSEAKAPRETVTVKMMISFSMPCDRRQCLDYNASRCQ